MKWKCVQCCAPNEKWTLDFSIRCDSNSSSTTTFTRANWKWPVNCSACKWSIAKNKCYFQFENYQHKIIMYSCWMLELNPAFWNPVIRSMFTSLLAIMRACVGTVYIHCTVYMRCCNRIFSPYHIFVPLAYHFSAFLLDQIILAIANHFTITLLYANTINTLAIFYQIIRFWCCVRSHFSLHFAIDFSHIYSFVFGNLAAHIRYEVIMMFIPRRR